MIYNYALFGFSFAYLDPGTGSILVQAIIGVGAGVAVFGRRVIGRVASKAKALFSARER